jgi:hypothetical protein
VIAPLFWRVPASSLRVGDAVAIDASRRAVRYVARIDRSGDDRPARALLSHSLVMIPLVDGVSVDRLVHRGAS